MRSLSGTTYGDVADAYCRYISLVGLEKSDIIECMPALECQPIWEKQYVVNHDGLSVKACKYKNYNP